MLMTPSRIRQAGAVTPGGAVAELIDVAITGVYPSTTEARQTGRWFLI
jgi:hypothetical protein